MYFLGSVQILADLYQLHYANSGLLLWNKISINSSSQKLLTNVVKMILGLSTLKIVCDSSNRMKIILWLAPYVWYGTACENAVPKTFENFMQHFYWIIFFRALVKRHWRITYNIFIGLFSWEPWSKDIWEFHVHVMFLRYYFQENPHQKILT